MSVHCVICAISSIERLSSQVIQLVKLRAKKAARNTAEKAVRRVEGSSHKGYKRVDALGAENRNSMLVWECLEPTLHQCPEPAWRFTGLSKYSYKYLNWGYNYL